MHKVVLNSFFHYEIKDVGEGVFSLREYADADCPGMDQREKFADHEGRELLRFKASEQLQVTSHTSAPGFEDEEVIGSFPPVLNVNGATKGVMCGDDFIGWHLELRQFYTDDGPDGLPNWQEE